MPIPPLEFPKSASEKIGFPPDQFTVFRKCTSLKWLRLLWVYFSMGISGIDQKLNLVVIVFDDFDLTIFFFNFFY